MLGYPTLLATSTGWFYVYHEVDAHCKRGKGETAGNVAATANGGQHGGMQQLLPQEQPAADEAAIVATVGHSVSWRGRPQQCLGC
jgi:hypothetical protein